MNNERRLRPNVRNRVLAEMLGEAEKKLIKQSELRNNLIHAFEEQDNEKEKLLHLCEKQNKQLQADINKMNRKRMKEELLDAFCTGNIDKVLFLARDLPDPAKASIPIIVIDCKSQPKKFFSPLVSSIAFGNYHLCKLLIDAGVSVDKYYDYQPYPLSLALQENHSDIAELLIASGADVKATSLINDTTYPMYFAIYHNNPPSIIEQIILAGFPVDQAVIKTENLTAIQCASLSNNIEAAEVLVKYKANLNSVNFRGESAITIAVRQNFLEMVKFLVSKGAKLENRRTAMSPLLLAIRLEHLKMVELLLDMGASIKEGWVARKIVSPLQFASSYLNISIIKLLINKGADVNATNVLSKETPLHVTSSYLGLKYSGKTLAAIQTKVAKVLIDKGACVNAKDSDGRTPLDCAIYSENTDLCKILLREGADITKPGCINGMGIENNRFEYIVCVSTFTCPELIELCLERGCDYNYRDKHGLTPYHCALAKHNPKMVKVFWRYGCPYDLPEHIPGKMKSMLQYDPNPENKKILAIQSKYVDGVIRNNILLVMSALEKGAEPRGCCMKIQSILHYAAVRRNHHIIRLLLEKGVPVNRLNEEGQTPLYIAMEKKDFKTVSVLLQFGACINYYNPDKGKPLKLLAKKNKDILLLFKVIYKAFGMARNGNFRVIVTLKEFVDANDIPLVRVVMNCVSGQGLTLMGTALLSGHLQLAKALMLLRIRINS